VSPSNVQLRTSPDDCVVVLPEGPPNFETGDCRHMPSIVSAIVGRQGSARRLSPRSVIPGRQRWDVAVVLRQPRVAELLEARLRESPGVGMVRANPVTGRLLIFHDTTLSSTDVDQLIREAVAVIIRQVVTLTGSSGPEPGVAPTRVRHRRDSAPTFVAAGCAVVALALGKSSIRRSPLVHLGSIISATVIIVRRGWRRSSRAQQTSAVPLRSTQHPLLQIVGSYRRQFYLASSLSILGQILDMVPGLFVAWILLLFTTGKSAALVHLGLTSITAQLWFLVGVTALTFIVAAALSFFSGVLWRDLAQSIQHRWRTEMYAHIQRAELRHLEGERTTRLARVLTNDVKQLGRFFDTSANDLLQAMTGFLVLIPMFLFSAPSIAWIAILPVPIIAWLSFFNQERTAPAYAASGEKESLLNSQLVNNLEASATVKSFGAESYEINRIHRLSDEYRLSSHRIDTRTAAYTQTVRLSTMLSLTGFLLGGGLDVLAGKLPFGTFNALIGLPNLVLWKLPAVGGAVDQYQQTVAALGRVLGLRRLPIESRSSGERLDVAQVQGEMMLDGVTFAYPSRPPILTNLSLRIAARSTTGIVGVTGAGKSTIAKLLLRFQDVESGRVLLDGRDVRDVRLHDLRSAISFVAQDTFLFDGTVNENITYGSFDANRERVVSAARLAEADSFIQALPFRYDTMVGERGTTLSGGQKQRISLARAIVKNAPIVILDEATSAVDNETEMAIHHALADFARDRTLIIIAHRLSTIRHADWIYVLGQGGVIIEEGTHHELLQREGMYASLWRLQIGETSA
jgi:ATP-binding cassette, subfamily B, bacterial